jgi:hypothetical protein
MKIAESLLPTLPADYHAAPRIQLCCAGDVDEHEVRLYQTKEERRPVAAVELVSPPNKDRQETRAAFVAKCASPLQQNVSVAIVEVVTDHGSNLYSELLALLVKADAIAKSKPPNIYAVACRAKRPRKR